jgi:DNA polymerase-4
MPASTDDELVFAPIARSLVHGLWSPGVGVRLLGVGISGFDARAEQLVFLDAAGDGSVGAPAAHDADRSQRGDLVRGIDAVRERFGDDAVRFGRDLMHPGRMRKATETEDE